MAHVLWLDNELDQIRGGVSALQVRGHAVQVVSNEAGAISQLDANPPDLMIQDLHRTRNFAKVAGVPRLGPSARHEAGWSFYDEVLRLVYPWLPVIICSLDSSTAENRRRADDYNLWLVPKRGYAHQGIVQAVERVIAAQRPIVSPRLGIPSVLVPDFEAVNSELLKHLARKPRDVHRLTWAGFERLVARILSELGYEVEHTRLTRDGGVDIWALRRSDLGETLYAIDAKKYSPTRLVGPEPVRAIYGVASMEEASVGMIVTTSRFSADARLLADQHRFRLSLKDFDDLSAWLARIGA